MSSCYTPAGVSQSLKRWGGYVSDVHECSYYRVELAPRQRTGVRISIEKVKIGSGISSSRKRDQERSPENSRDQRAKNVVGIGKKVGWLKCERAIGRI